MVKKLYSVKEVTKMAGISPRTLRHYDQIGILTPACRTEGSYRMYGQAELLRLQQILFYRELDFSLKEIADLLDDPDFDQIDALTQHRRALVERHSRLTRLMKTIDQTIHQLTIGDIMSDPKQLYEGLPKEYGTAYRQQAMDEYGQQAVDQSEQELMKLGKQGFQQLQKDFKDLNEQLFHVRETTPESPPVQKLIAEHYRIIRQFWGTTDESDNQAEAYAGLGQHYVNDERFCMVNGEPQPVFAAFLKAAMQVFAERELGLE